MTPATLRQLLIDTGSALYGARWQSALADDLRVDRRTIRRWATGSHDVPLGVAAEIRGLLMARGAKIAGLLTRLEK